MKKIILSGAALVGALTLSGCGTETLSCTMTDESDLYNMTKEIKATFDGKQTKSVEAIMTMKVDESYADSMDSLKSSIESEMADYEEKYGVDTDLNVNGTTLKYSMKADASKMTDEAKSLFGFDTSADQSKEAAQKSLEDAGYTCK